MVSFYFNNLQGIAPCYYMYYFYKPSQKLGSVLGLKYAIYNSASLEIDWHKYS